MTVPPISTRPSVRVPAELTALRDKVARGDRVTAYEANRVCELEAWLNDETRRVVDEWLAKGGD